MHNANIKLLTPVHVGSGVTLNRDIDFIIAEGRVYFIDPARVLDLLGNDYINQWVNAINRGTPLMNLLAERGIRATPDKLSSQSAVLRHGGNAVTQLKRQQTAALQGPCIPGSAIKGAIRTALLERLSELDSQLNGSMLQKENRRGQREFKDDAVLKRIFGDDPNKSSMRFLKVGDAYFPGQETEVSEMRILNLEANEWRFKRGQQLLIENIPPGKKAELRIALDARHLELNKKEHRQLWDRVQTGWVSGGVSALCKAVNDCTRSLLEWEIEIWQRECDEGYANEEAENMLEEYKRLYKEATGCGASEMLLRIGGHSGWVFTTSGWMRKLPAERLSDEVLNNLRRTVQKRDYSGMDIWPKTRKITAPGGLFGFVKLTITP